MKDSGCSDGSLFLSCFPKPLEASGDARYDALWRTELSCTDAGGAAQTYYCGAAYKADAGTSYTDWRGAAVMAIISWCAVRPEAEEKMRSRRPTALRATALLTLNPSLNPQVVLQDARSKPGGAAARGPGVGGGGARRSALRRDAHPPPSPPASRILAYT